LGCFIFEYEGGIIPYNGAIRLMIGKFMVQSVIFVYF